MGLVQNFPLGKIIPGPSFPRRKNRPSIEFPPKRQYAFSPFVKSRHSPSPVLLLEFSYYLEFCLVHHHSNLIILCEINHSNCVMVYWNPDPHRSPINRLLRHTRGCGGPILTRILTGTFEYLESIELFKLFLHQTTNKEVGE